MDAAQLPKLQIRNAISSENLAISNQRYAIPRPLDRVKEYTTLRDVFLACSQALSWPCEFMTLIIDDQVFDFPRLISRQGHLDMKVIDVVQPQPLDEILVRYHLQIPSNFQDPNAQGYCLCNFGGCCKLCKVPGGEICSGCGNNGCCRSNDCGCECCLAGSTNNSFQPVRRCPRVGCQPRWSDSNLPDP